MQARLLLLLVFIASSYGCGTNKFLSGMFEDEDNLATPAALTNFVATTTINRIWSERVNKGSDVLFIKLVPAVLGQQIFVADPQGNIAAVDVSTGNLIWENETELAITGGLGVDHGIVMAGTDGGDVVTFSADTGQELWRAKVSSEILSEPIQAAGIVIVRTIDGKIFALDVTNGNRLWVYDRTVPALTLRGTGTPVIANGLVIAGFDSGRVAALQLKTGQLVWEQRVAISKGRTELERIIDIDAQPLVVNGIIYVAIFQASVAALALDSGKIIWQRDISSHSELSADDDNLYVTDDEDFVWALDRLSGASVWKQEKLYARRLTGPTVFGNKVIVGDFKGYLHWLNKTTGAFSAQNQVSEARILLNPIVVMDQLLNYSSDGTLAMYSYADNNIIQQPLQEEALEQPTSKSSRVEQKQEKSFFGRFVDIFTGDPDADQADQNKLQKVQ